MKLFPTYNTHERVHMTDLKSIRAGERELPTFNITFLFLSVTQNLKYTFFLSLNHFVVVYKFYKGE